MSCGSSGASGNCKASFASSLGFPFLSHKFFESDTDRLMVPSVFNFANFGAVWG